MIALSASARERLRCPRCRAALAESGDGLACTSATCGAVFPVLRGVPVLVNEASSVFRLADYGSASPELLSSEQDSFAARLKRFVPSNGDNAVAVANFARLRALLDAEERRRVLVIGGGVLGRGIAALFAGTTLDVVETDVWLGPRTQIVCDAHDLPFADGAFDAVVAQAVLEHVADPARCVTEIHRVLAADGFVYAETPFMQQVHLGPYDFTRFTLLGHRRLFRAFGEIDSGAVSGPALALMWAYENFLLGFVHGPLARNLVKAFARCTSFPLKYVDRWLRPRPAALDGACAVFFLGRRADHPIGDRELIAQYRGAQAGVWAPTDR